MTCGPRISRLSPVPSRCGDGRRARFSPGRGSSGALAVRGFCTWSYRVQTPLHGTWHICRQWRSPRWTCAAPYQQSEWPRSSGCCGPSRAPSTMSSRPGPDERSTPRQANMFLERWACSERWPRQYGWRRIWPCSPLVSSLPATGFGLERPPVSAGRMSASQDGSASTIASLRGRGSRPSWQHGRSAGDRPGWHARSYNAGPNTL